MSTQENATTMLPDPSHQSATPEARAAMRALAVHVGQVITFTEQRQVEALIGCTVKPVGSLYPAGVLKRCNDFMMTIGESAYVWSCHNVEVLALPKRDALTQCVVSASVLTASVETQRTPEARAALAADAIAQWAASTQLHDSVTVECKLPGARSGKSRAIADFMAQHADVRFIVAERESIDPAFGLPPAEQSECTRCDGSGVLRGFGFGASIDAVDRPCGCKPAKVKGPSKWTITKREEVEPGDYWAHGEAVWNIEARKGDAVFVGFVSTSQRQTRVARKPWGNCGETVLEIRGERAPDMAIARLLCGLRDGTVTVK